MKTFYFAFSLLLLVPTFVYSETENAAAKAEVSEACLKVKNKKFPPPNKAVGGQKVLDDLGYFNKLADPKNPNYDLDLALKWICESSSSASRNSMAEVILEIDKQKNNKTKTAIDICSFITSSRDGNHCAFLRADEVLSLLEKEIQVIRKNLKGDLLSDFDKLNKIIDSFAESEGDYIHLSYGIGLGASGGRITAHQHIKETYTRILLTHIRKKPKIDKFNKNEFARADQELNQKFRKMKEGASEGANDEKEEERTKRLADEKNLSDSLVSAQKQWIQLKEKSGKFFSKKYLSEDFNIYIQYLMTQQRLRDLDRNF